MFAFEPTRLSVALRRRGITQKELAHKCGITPQYVSMFERGQTTPQVGMVNQFADILSFPQPFFYQGAIKPLQADALSFRANDRSLTREIRDIGLGSGDIASQIIIPDLANRYVLPVSYIPDLSSESPENAAKLLRAEWGLGDGPISNIVHVMEQKGIRAFWVRHESNTMDAYSFWADEQPYVVFNDFKTAGERARFDAAHELGHIVLHQQISLFSGRKIEEEANRFSAAFIIPPEVFIKEFPDEPDLFQLYQLKRKWKMSVNAMVKYGADLGKFSDWQTRQAYAKLTKLGMRTNEKLRFPREKSMLHSKVFDKLQNKGMVPAEYAEELMLSSNDLFELMPVAKGFEKRQMPSHNSLRRLDGPFFKVIQGGKSPS